MDSILHLLFPENSDFGCLSLLPPLVAIALAITTRKVIISLAAGIGTGLVLVASETPMDANDSSWQYAFRCVKTFAVELDSHLWRSLSNSDHLRVFAFTLLMGAMVGVMRKSGGMEAIVRSIAPLARSRRGGQLTVWLLGLIVFFDDYANTLLLGNTMRPLADRLRISREKLAYLVDATAAPVSGLALISTWVATEISYVQTGLDDVQLADQPTAFAVFVATIPYRFYVLWALVLVPLVGLLGRDFGPMLRAERQALAKPRAAEDESRGEPAHWANALFPVLTVVAVTVVLILVTGAASLDGAAPTLMNVFGKGDSYVALVYGSLMGLLVAMLLPRMNTCLTWPDIQQAAGNGAKQVSVALVILWLAWALSGLTESEYLGTGAYLGELLRDGLDPRFLPTLVFVLASVVAFSTGTSWGTMGILTPLVVSVSAQLLSAGGSPVVSTNPILVASIGSVLAGAIFGDHCSPISDTTVLSSQASGCKHVAHVRTQLPYALTVGGLSVICGTLPIGFGVSVWVLLPLGVIALVVCLLLIGREPTPTPVS